MVPPGFQKAAKASGLGYHHRANAWEIWGAECHRRRHARGIAT